MTGKAARDESARNKIFAGRWIVALLFLLAGSTGCSPSKTESPPLLVTVELHEDKSSPWSVSVINPDSFTVKPILENERWQGSVVLIGAGKFLTLERAGSAVKYTIHDPNLAKLRIEVSKSKLDLLNNGQRVESPFSPTNKEGTVSVSQR